MKRLCLLAALAGMLLGASPAAAAFTAPELFVRQQKWDTHEETGPWMPLAAAPSVNYLGGYEVGFKLQASGEPNNLQRAALEITGVPDGTPTQPGSTSPYCVTRIGAPGTIVPAGPELQFEGDGAYTVKVSIGAGTGDGDDCLAGPSRSGSFGVDVHVIPVLVGEPLSFRVAPLPGDPFVGVQAAAPPGGQADVQCTLGTLVVPDPSFPHPAAIEDVFTRPGQWSCMARGVAEGRDDDHDIVNFATPWSAPLLVDVRSDFRRAAGSISRPRSSRPRFTFKAEWPDEAAGGRATLKLSRVTGCKGRRFKLRRAATIHGRFGAKQMRVTIRRPRKLAFYTGTFTFGGTRFLRAGVDPFPVLLRRTKKRFGFIDPRGFPRCPGYRA